MATTIIAEKDLSRDLYEANAGYRQYYGQMNLYKEANEQASAASYNSAIADAYKTAQSKQSQLNTMGYDENTRKSLSNSLNQALMSAYDTYRAKHTQGVMEANQEIDSDIQTVNENLHAVGQELGSKQAQYQEGAFDYLGYLNQNGYFSKGGQFDTYDEYISWFDTNNPGRVDAQGNEVAPMDEAQWRAEWAKQQVFKGVFNEDGSINEDKLKVAIFSELDDDGNIVKDENGQPVLTENLNTKGIEMLDRLNAMPSEQFESYASWLSKEDPELYEWAVQRSLLGFGTNGQIAMSKLGADGIYSFMERFGGLTAEETKKLFDKIDIATQRVDWGKVDDVTKISKDNYEALNKAMDTVRDLYSYLDMDNALQVQIQTEDGTEIELKSLDEMIAWEFAQASELDYEEVKKAWETGDFKAITVDTSEQRKDNMVGGILVGLAAAAAPIPVFGWIVAGFCLFGAAIAFGIGGANTQAKVNAIGEANAQQGEFKRAFDYYAVQSAAVASELRRSALGQK